MNSTVTADAKFLRRVFLVLVILTTIAGSMVALTAVQARASMGQTSCLLFCE